MSAHEPRIGAGKRVVGIVTIGQAGARLAGPLVHDHPSTSSSTSGSDESPMPPDA